jgi:hypothetical protein
VAVTRQGSAFKAVRLENSQDRIKVLEFIEIADSEASWEHFCKYVHTSGQAGTDTAIAFDADSISFYCLAVPPSADSDLGRMVRLRVESMLPLPIEQMQFAWAPGEDSNGKKLVTVAAARSDHLRAFVNSVKICTPSRIVLDCEVICKAWSTFCKSGNGAAVLISPGESNTRVCLCSNGRFANAVTLDYKASDLLNAEDGIQCERLSQDLVGIFEHFKIETSQVPVSIFSKSSQYSRLSACIKSMGFEIQESEPSFDQLEICCQLPSDLSSFMLPLGLGYISLSDYPGELNLFENLYQPVKRRSHTALKDGATLKRLAFLATAFIVVFCLAGYGVDWLKLNRLKAYNQTTDPNLNVNVRLEQERIRKVIATERPDLLDLLDKVNSVQTEGITLTSFSFKKGQHVSMNGFARGL